MAKPNFNNSPSQGNVSEIEKAEAYINFYSPRDNGTKGKATESIRLKRSNPAHAEILDCAKEFGAEAAMADFKANLILDFQLATSETATLGMRERLLAAQKTG